MTLEVRLQRFETQYRLPLGARAARRRLDQIKINALDTAFEMALNQTGMGNEAEVCMRHLFVPVRLSLRGSDQSITATWSAALAAEITRVVRHGSTADIVVYHSRRQALGDLAFSVARGDLSRAWAWRQLGMWRSGDKASDSEAVVELVRNLREAPAMVVPTLQSVAQIGWLPMVVRRLTGAQWEYLAWAACGEVGAAHLLEEAEGLSSARVLLDAQRVLKSSVLLRAVDSQALSSVARASRRAIAALAVMDADLSLLRREAAPTLIGIIADALPFTPVEIVSASSETKPSSAAEVKQTAPFDQEYNSAAAGERLEPESIDLVESNDPDAVARVRPTGAHAPEGSPQLDSSSKSELLDLRRRGLTRFGGLLFLIAVSEELNLPEEILAHELLGMRPFVWVLHQLALALAGLEPNDPAALAFAGLLPDAKPPSAGEAVPSESETRAVNALVALIVAHLCLRLQRDPEAENSVLDFVCSRRAEIVADPGWLEVRLSLDDVTTDIRRAGLDLNPGYVSWLGVVVMFVYE